MVFTVLPLFVLFTLSHGAIYISRGFGDGDVVFPKPDGSILPPHCSHFRAACRAEAEGRYEDAFKVYESKYEECGSHGWSIEGGSRGSLSFVVFKTTPCGLRVAVKRLTDPKECNILKLMTSKESQAACPGCFPAYYYFSNATKACYSEHVYSPLGFEQFLPIRQDLLIPRRLRAIKAAFLQGLAAIHLLRRHNWEHGDLGLRNILFRNTTLEDGQAGLHVVLIDFGGALPVDRYIRPEVFDEMEEEARLIKLKYQMSKRNSTDGAPRLDEKKHEVKQSELAISRQRPHQRHLGQNGPHTDVYMLAKAFLTGSSGGNAGWNSAKALIDMFRSIMAANDRRQEPDYAGIASMVHQFTLVETVEQ